MTKLEAIQHSIERLTPEQIARLNAWIDELQEKLFDDAIERGALRASWTPWPTRPSPITRPAERARDEAQRQRGFLGGRSIEL